MTPTEAPLRRALSTMAEQVEVVDLAGRVAARMRRRRRRTQVAALLAAACVAMCSINSDLFTGVPPLKGISQ